MPEDISIEASPIPADGPGFSARRGFPQPAAAPAARGVLARIDNETLKARVEKIEQELRAHGLQGLVLYANGSALGNQSFMHGYLRYLCDFDGHNTPAMLILRPGHAPVLLTGNKPYLRAHLAEKSLWFRDVRHVRPHLFGAEAAAILARQPETAGRVAYLGYDETPAPVWKSLEAGLSR